MNINAPDLLKSCFQSHLKKNTTGVSAHKTSPTMPFSISFWSRSEYGDG